MKIWAKVMLKEEKNAECLIRSFFGNFNPESSIAITGKEAKLEIIFNNNNIPMPLIEAINSCDVIEFNFGKRLVEYCEETPAQTEEPEEDPAQAEEPEEIPEQDEEPEEALAQAEEPEETPAQAEEPEETLAQAEEPEETPEQAEEPEETLAQAEEQEEDPEQAEEPEEIPEQDEEPEEAPAQVEETEETPEQAEEPEETPEQAEEPEEIPAQTEHPKRKSGRAVVLEKVNIPMLEEKAKEATSFEHFVNLVAESLEMGKRQNFFANLVYTATEVAIISWKEIEDALRSKSISYSSWDKIFTGQQVSKKLNVTILPFLYTMVQYKDSFGKKSEENAEQETAVSIVLEEVHSKIKLECMPEIPHFEQILGSVDKTQPIEQSVRKILNCMGLEDKPEQEQVEILSFVIQVFEGKETSMTSKINFSTFLNNFVGKYSPGKKVKAFKFLQQLQVIVM